MDGAISAALIPYLREIRANTYMVTLISVKLISVSLKESLREAKKLAESLKRTKVILGRVGFKESEEGALAFSFCSTLTTITIPETVSQIYFDSDAFIN